jgi:type IV pilus assembly protein PilB
MAESKKLGELLKEAGLIDDFQLQTALSYQRNWGGKLGAILIELEFVREEDLAKIIADKLRTQYVNLFNPEVPRDIINLIKGDVAKKYNVVPARKEGGTLVVAMADPLDFEAVDALRFIINLKIKPALALESEIKDAIRKYYDGEDVVRKTKTTFRDITAAAGKMEIIHGSDLKMAPPAGTNSPILPQEESARQELSDSKIRLDALISLLIEKNLITRDELTKMIYQKKIGL